jgi:hypothetical protein
MDFLSGVDFTIDRDWTVGLSYQYWVSPSDAFESASLLETTVSYGGQFLERSIRGKFSLNPYFKFFIELDNKATVSSTDESYYVEVGFGPRYVFEGYPLTIDMHTFVTFPGNGFYSENSTVGLFSTGLKVTAPLTSIPKRYGAWSVYTGFRYYYIVNDGILNDGILTGNGQLPPGSESRNQAHALGGVTLAF